MTEQDTLDDAINYKQNTYIVIDCQCATLFSLNLYMTGYIGRICLVDQYCGTNADIYDNCRATPDPRLLTMESVPEYDIKKGYIPGSIGRIAELHGTYYHKHWKFGLQFESKVAIELSEFLQRYNKNTDGIWIATGDDRIEGSIVVDGIHAGSKGAHLRWFIVSDTLRGKGVGENLANRAVKFCRARGYPRMYLWTFEGLDSARHLYEKIGFQLIKQQPGEQWGTTVNEQYFECRL